MKYLCGCTVESKENYSFHTLPLIRGMEPQFTSNRFDEEGFMVCPQHGSRLENWRTIPKSENHPGPKTGYMSMSPLEIERRRLFGKPIPKRRPLKINFNMPDTRDTTDPQTLGMEILGRSNGHAAN